MRYRQRVSLCGPVWVHMRGAQFVRDVERCCLKMCLHSVQHLCIYFHAISLVGTRYNNFASTACVVHTDVLRLRTARPNVQRHLPSKGALIIYVFQKTGGNQRVRTLSFPIFSLLAHLILEILFPAESSPILQSLIIGSVSVGIS